MQERRSNFVAPIFAKSDLDDVCESITIQDCADGISHIEHQDPQPAVNLVGARTASVARLANAADRCQRPIDEANDGAEFDPAHRAREGVPAEFSASAHHVAGGFQLCENLLKKLDRQFFF